MAEFAEGADKPALVAALPNSFDEIYPPPGPAGFGSRASPGEVRIEQLGGGVTHALQSHASFSSSVSIDTPTRSMIHDVALLTPGPSASWQASGPHRASPGNPIPVYFSALAPRHTPEENTALQVLRANFQPKPVATTASGRASFTSPGLSSPLAVSANTPRRSQDIFDVPESPPVASRASSQQQQAQRQKELQQVQVASPMWPTNPLMQVPSPLLPSLVGAPGAKALAAAATTRNPQSLGNPAGWHIEMQAHSILPTYYRNDRKALQCFPYCPLFGSYESSIRNPQLGGGAAASTPGASQEDGGSASLASKFSSGRVKHNEGSACRGPVMVRAHFPPTTLGPNQVYASVLRFVRDESANNNAPSHASLKIVAVSARDPSALSLEDVSGTEIMTGTTLPGRLLMDTGFVAYESNPQAWFVGGARPEPPGTPAEPTMTPLNPVSGMKSISADKSKPPPGSEIRTFVFTPRSWKMDGVLQRTVRDSGYAAKKYRLEALVVSLTWSPPSVSTTVPTLEDFRNCEGVHVISRAMSEAFEVLNCKTLVRDMNKRGLRSEAGSSARPAKRAKSDSHEEEEADAPVGSFRAKLENAEVD